MPRWETAGDISTLTEGFSTNQKIRRGRRGGAEKKNVFDWWENSVSLLSQFPFFLESLCTHMLAWTEASMVAAGGGLPRNIYFGLAKPCAVGISSVELELESTALCPHVSSCFATRTMPLSVCGAGSCEPLLFLPTCFYFATMPAASFFLWLCIFQCFKMVYQNHCMTTWCTSTTVVYSINSTVGQNKNTPLLWKSDVKDRTRIWTALFISSTGMICKECRVECDHRFSTLSPDGHYRVVP